MEKTTIEALSRFKNLNSDQIASCQQAARNDVINRLGPQPVLKKFMEQVSIRSGMQPNDVVGVILFLVLLTISLIHMINFTGGLAKESYVNTVTNGGIFFTIAFWVKAHQLAFFAFSELGVLFFYIRHTMGYLRWRDEMIAAEKQAIVEKRWLRRWLSISSISAIACAVVAVVANVSSLVHGVEGWLVAISAAIGFMIPFLTLLLGERAAEILMAYMYARERAEAEFREVSDRWRYSADNPELYDAGDRVNSFKYYLARRIVEYYKKNIEPRMSPRLAEWTNELESALAGRELARLKRTSDVDAAEAFFTQPPSSAEGEGRLLSATINSNDSPESWQNNSTNGWKEQFQTSL